MKSINWKYVVVAALVLLAVCSLMGYQLIDPQILASLGAMPLITKSERDNLTPVMQETLQIIEDSNRELKEFKTVHVKRIDELEKRMGRPFAGAGSFELSATPDQAEYRKAFSNYLRTGEGDGRELRELGRKAMNTGSDPDGGYLVVPEMDSAIDRIAPTISAMFRLANNVTIGTAKWEKLVKTSGMAMRRVAEGATGGETTEPVYTKVAIEVFPSEVEPWVYNETLEDASINLEADLADEAAIAFAEGGGAEFISGNGVGKARGILSYTAVANSSYAWGSLGYVVSGAAGAFKTPSTSVNPADALIDLVQALNPKYRAGASWLMNNSTAGAVRKLKDADGRHVWVDSLINGQPSMLLGYPVETDDNMPDVGAGSYSIAFGDFKRGYAIVNRTGTTLIRDNITSKGQTKFNFRRRFGGGITHFEAIKLMKFATS